MNYFCEKFLHIKVNIKTQKKSKLILQYEILSVIKSSLIKRIITVKICDLMIA